MYEEILNEMAQKISDLKEMNKDEEIPELETEYKALKQQFDNAKTLSNQLEGVMANFTDERENLQKEIEAESDWLTQMKDRLGKCDDVSGTDEDLVKRLQGCKVGCFLFCHLCFMSESISDIIDITLSHIETNFENIVTKGEMAHN